MLFILYIYILCYSFQRTFEGATGRVSFNEKGIREDFVLFVTELGTDGLEEVNYFWMWINIDLNDHITELDKKSIQ